MGYLIALFVVCYILDYIVTKTPTVEIISYLILAFIVFKLIQFVIRKWRRSAQRRREVERFQQANKNYQNACERVHIPKDHTKVYFMDCSLKHPDLFLGLMYCWIEKRKLCLFPYAPTGDNYFYYREELDVVRIPIRQILEYKQDGQMVYYNNIFGGDVKVKASSSIIGDHTKTNSSIEITPLQSHLNVSDYRNMTMSFKDAQGEIQEMILTYDSYPYLYELLPTKDAEVVKEKQMKKLVKSKPPKETNELDMLKEYAKLYERGILTKKELDQKKKELLNKSLVK